MYVTDKRNITSENEEQRTMTPCTVFRDMSQVGSQSTQPPTSHDNSKSTSNPQHQPQSQVRPHRSISFDRSRFTYPQQGNGNSWK